MKKTIFFCFSVSMLFLPLISLAATISAGSQVFVDKTKTVSDNLYVVGVEESVAGTINGDFTAAGRSILMTGSVSGDGLIFGEEIDLIDKIAGDLRAAGGKILIGDSVGGDAVVAGSSVVLLPKASVGHDFIMAAGSAILDGTINGRVIAKGGSLNVGGNVAGSVNFEGDHLLIGKNAVIGGDLVYTKESVVTIEDGAVIKGVKKITEVSAPVAAHKSFVALSMATFGAMFFFKLLATLVAALIFGLLFKKRAEAFVDQSVNNFGQSLLVGFVALILCPIVIVFLFMTLIGAIIGATAGIAFIGFLILAHVFTGIFIGAILFRYFLRSQEVVVNWKSITVGVVINYFLWLVPFIGPIVAAVACLTSFGAIFRLCYKSLWLNR